MDNANVVEADLFASNGVIHVINSVILPAAEPAQKAPVSLVMLD